MIIYRAIVVEYFFRTMCECVLY